MYRISLLIMALALLSAVSPLSGAGPAAAKVTTLKLSPGAYLHLATQDNWKWSPAIAYATQHDDYLVVWETVLVGGHHAIFGRRVTALAQMGPEFLVYSGDYNSLQPAVAYDGTHDRYLVVWTYDSAGDGQDNDIYGRFIPWDGPSAGEAAFGVDNSRYNTDKPRLAYSPTSDEFLIAWKVEASPAYIAGGLIFANKTGLPVDISSGPEERDFPDVTYNLARNEFIVTWDEFVDHDDRGLDVYAIRLDHDGAPMGTGEFAVATGAFNEQHPSVAACSAADTYFLVWQQQVNHTTDDNIFGRMISGAGVLGPSYGVAGTTLPQRYPRVTCNPRGYEFFMVWHDQYADPLLRWGVWASVVSPNFVKEAVNFQVVAPNDYADRLYPVAAAGKNTYLVVWQHGRDSVSYLDIWGQEVRLIAGYLPSVRK
jgi:hypothetical protein